MSMTRQEQLDAVVRNYGAWAENKNHLLAFWNYGFVDYVLPAELVNGKFRGEFYCFTRAEVEQRKAELQNKPSWDDARFSDAEYMAQDANGQWVLYSGKPVADKSHGLFVHGNANKDISVTTGKGEVIGDWRDTLEKRPVADDQPTPEEDEAFKMLEAVNSDRPSHAEVIDMLEKYKNMEVRNTEHAGGDYKPETGSWAVSKGGDVMFYVGIGASGKHIFELKNGGVTGLDSLSGFSPIKSDREKFVGDCIDFFIENHDDKPIPDVFAGVAGIIYDAIVSGQLPVPEVKS